MGEGGVCGPSSEYGSNVGAKKPSAVESKAVGHENVADGSIAVEGGRVE